MEKYQESQIAITCGSEVCLLGGSRGWRTFMPLFSIVLASILRKLSGQCLPFVTVQVSSFKKC